MVLKKEKLTAYEKKLVSILFVSIALLLEVVFVYQYATTGRIKFSPTAQISGDIAFYFVAILGCGLIIYLPIAIRALLRPSQ